jgi:glycosyltransferase involved in cell wall biosynthesis
MDSSPAICEEYAKKDKRVTVINNTQNKGSSLARRIGLDVARGDYILFVDSDDWLEHNMLELMYNKVINDDLDIVYCRMYINTDSKQKEFDFPLLDDKMEMIKEIATWKKFTPSVCNKLIKHKIYKNITFPIINYGEDRQIILQAIHCASKIGYLQISLYHYYVNNASLCNSSSKTLQRYTDKYEITLWIIQFLKKNYSACFDIFEPELSASVNSLKFYFVLEKSIRDISKLHELYPVSNKRIFNTAWNDFFLKKIILFLAVNNITWLAYPLSWLFKALKRIYRLFISKNIRYVIWEKRNATKEKHKA